MSVYRIFINANLKSSNDIDMKKILVPTDFSKLSNHAVDFAAHLAKPSKAEVVIIHFEDLPLGDTSLHLTGDAAKGGFNEDSLFSAQLFRANKNKLTELSRKYTSDQVTVTGLQMGGGFLKGIAHYLKKNEVDLIVIGTTGEESIQEFFTGNHTEQLIENLTIPVISVQQEVDKKIEDVVLGLDLIDEKYSMKAFSMIRKIMRSLDARLHIVNVIDTELPNNLLYDLNKTAKIVGLKNYTVDTIKSKNENQALMDFADGLRAGMIITLTEARSGLYRFFQHSFATKMTQTSEIPVLTINKRHLVQKS